MRRVLRQQKQTPAWLILAIALVILAFWQWQLVMATMIGGFTLIFVYLVQDWDGNLILARINRFLSSPNRSMIVAAIAGGLAILLSYGFLMVWSTVENHWLAGLGILQILVTLTGVLIFSLKSLRQWQHHAQQNINYLTAQLTAADELEKLIALKHLSQALHHSRLPLRQEQAIAQCCQILLSQNQPEIIRTATLEVLEELKYLQTQLGELPTAPPPKPSAMHSTNPPSHLKFRP